MKLFHSAASYVGEASLTLAVIVLGVLLVWTAPVTHSEDRVPLVLDWSIDPIGLPQAESPVRWEWFEIRPEDWPDIKLEHTERFYDPENFLHEYVLTWRGPGLPTVTFIDHSNMVDGRPLVTEIAIANLDQRLLDVAWSITTVIKQRRTIGGGTA